MASDDLILILDNGSDLVLVDDDAADTILVDDVPYAEHYPHYPGPYVVNPIFHDDQELRTADMVMDDDVTVKAIKVTDTVNPYGGRTIVIG